MEQFVEEPMAEYQRFANNPDIIDIMRLHKKELPPLRFDCGIDDDLIDANRKLHRQLKEEGIAHNYQEFSGGHAWPYWEKHLVETLMFFDSVVDKKAHKKK